MVIVDRYLIFPPGKSSKTAHSSIFQVENSQQQPSIRPKSVESIARKRAAETSYSAEFTQKPYRQRALNNFKTLKFSKSKTRTKQARICSGRAWSTKQTPVSKNRHFTHFPTKKRTCLPRYTKLEHIEQANYLF